MSYTVSYRVGKPEVTEIPVFSTAHETRSATAKQVSTWHRIATVCCQRMIQMINNTEMTIRHIHIRTMDEVLQYINGRHHDEDLPGDRGDFWRRQLADQIYTNYAVHGLDHTNILLVAHGAVELERTTRALLKNCALKQITQVDVDPTVLDILTRLADVQ